MLLWKQGYKGTAQSPRCAVFDVQIVLFPQIIKREVLQEIFSG
jgi:hypothetical protein